MSANSDPSVGYMTRTTEVQLQVSLDTLDTLLRYHYAMLSMSFANALPLDVEEYVKYCKSIVAYRTALVDSSPLPSDDMKSVGVAGTTSQDGVSKDTSKDKVVVTKVTPAVRTALRSCVLPCFLENFVSRIGIYHDVETGVRITWKRLDMETMSAEQLAEKSLQLAAVRTQNVDLTFNAVSMNPVSELDNAYIVDDDDVYGLGGTDVKGYQFAAALKVTLVHDEYKLLFRKRLSTMVAARQEVANGFGKAS